MGKGLDELQHNGVLMKWSTMLKGLDKVERNGEGLDEVGYDGEGS